MCIGLCGTSPSVTEIPNVKIEPQISVTLPKPVDQDWACTVAANDVSRKVGQHHLHEVTWVFGAGCLKTRQILWRVYPLLCRQMPSHLRQWHRQIPSTEEGPPLTQCLTLWLPAELHPLAWRASRTCSRLHDLRQVSSALPVKKLHTDVGPSANKSKGMGLLFSRLPHPCKHVGICRGFCVLVQVIGGRHLQRAHLACRLLNVSNLHDVTPEPQGSHIYT